jgi:1-phosphofructokinase family hexose kinase
MILTLTPNPTIDRTIFVRDFLLGAVIRAEREVVTPSGKGVDSSLVIRELGGDTVALGLNAGHTGDLLCVLLDEWRIAHDFCLALGETRTATVLVDLAVGQQSTISASTLTATEAHLTDLEDKLGCYAGQAWGLICGGSLPPGLPLDSYARLVRLARGRDVFTLLDTSGEALVRSVEGCAHALKVNQHELAALGVQRDELDPGRPGELAAFAGELRTYLGWWANQAIVVTLGENGALAVTEEGTYWAKPPVVPVSNTAGAGDALNGGLVLARMQGANWPSALALGTAAAASVVMNDGTAICRREQVYRLLDKVEVSLIGG